MKFVSNRDIVVASTSGHSIEFKKDAPTYVPREMRSEVMEKGILPVDGDGKLTQPVADPERKVGLPPEDAGEREEAIVAAMELIVERNNSGDFAGATPSAKAVTAITQWPADQKEVRRLWEKHREKLIKKG